MSTRRTSMVIAAVVLGGIASFALYRHLDGIEKKVYADARPVEVVVVDIAVAEGTSGDQALTGAAVSTRPMPAEFRPPTAVPSLESIRGKVAALDLPVGTIVVENMFVDPEQAELDTNADLIPEGLVAVSISVDQVRGVSGLVRPGDKVNMIIDDPASPGTKHVLFQNVDVLFVGQTPAPEPGADPAVAAAAAPADPGGGGLLTLAVPPLAASKIALVSDAGVYLALVPSDNVAVPVPPVNSENLVTGELTPGVTEGV